ncbi:hypothetical protein FB451DRAFT_1403257 [Mycena latifolia]|nr:hypothetical protein FB451DRAFT_1403257 [Mycena latifolia]
MFSAICNLPFTHLGHVFLKELSAALSVRTALALQQLLSVNTLCSVTLQAAFTEPSIWDRCSPNIVHLDLSYSSWSTHSAPRRIHPVSGPRLESFQIATVRYQWMTLPDIFSFDLSALKVLSIGRHAEVVRWQMMAPAFQTIVALNFSALGHANIIDISLFPNIVLLRICISPKVLSTALATFSTIPATNHIRKIVILTTNFLDAAACEQLDSKLSGLPIDPPPSVELEIRPGNYDRVVQCFPQLSSSNVIRRVDPNPQWFNDILQDIWTYLYPPTEGVAIYAYSEVMKQIQTIIETRNSYFRRPSMDSDSSAPPLLGLACRFLPHDQWFTTHVDPDWKVRQVKSWLLSKCLPYAAPPSPPLRQSTRKPQRPPSPITFAPDPRHRPISPITFAMPKQSPVMDDASEEDEDPPADDELTDPEPEAQEEQVAVRPPPPQKKRAIVSTVPTSAKGDLYSQFTLIRFSTGQLLEDELPLSFYDMQSDELLELHRLGVVVTLPRAQLTRYLDAYWEGWVRVLRMRPIDDEDDSYALYKIRPLETRALEWRDRWLVVREGSVYLCRDEARLIHTLSLADLTNLTNAAPLPAAATPATATRILLARFAVAPAGPPSHAPTRAPSPFQRAPLASDSSSSALSSPVFAHDSSDSGRRRRARPVRRRRKKPDPEYLALDLKDDSAYVSLLRVLHRQALPTSTFAAALPVGAGEHVPLSAGGAATDSDKDADEHDAPPPLRHPQSLANLHLHARGGRVLGALPFPEWRTTVLARARRAGMGRIGRAVEWVLYNGECRGEDDMGWAPRNGLSGEGEAVWGRNGGETRRRGRGKGKGRERALLPGSMDGYDSDVSGDEDASMSGSGSDSDSANEGGRGGRTGGRSETEWEGWMGDLRRQAREAQAALDRARAREEARRAAEAAREAELGLPGGGAGADAVEVSVVRVGTGEDDRLRRQAMEPSAVVVSLSGVNPAGSSHHGHGHTASSSASASYAYAHTSASGSGSVSTHVLSSPSSAESLVPFAFSPLAPPPPALDDAPHAAAYSAHPHHSAHAHAHTLLHSASMPFAPPGAEFARRPSMPVISGTARWGEQQSLTSRASSPDITEVPRNAPPPSIVRRASGKGVLRKKDKDREQSESDRRQAQTQSQQSQSQAHRRPRLSLSTSSPMIASPPLSPTPREDTAGMLPTPAVKKKRRGLARGVSIRAERLVKSLDSALDFVDGR